MASFPLVASSASAMRRCSFSGKAVRSPTMRRRTPFSSRRLTSARRALMNKSMSRVTFGFGTAPVLAAECKKGHGTDALSHALLNHGPNALDTGPVARGSGPIAPYRPAAVPVHDDGNVPRHAGGASIIGQHRAFSASTVAKSGRISKRRIRWTSGPLLFPRAPCPPP